MCVFVYEIISDYPVRCKMNKYLINSNQMCEMAFELKICESFTCEIHLIVIK